jgi:hypothetical protein
LWITHSWARPVGQTHWSVSKHRLSDASQVAETFLPSSPLGDTPGTDGMVALGQDLFVSTGWTLVRLAIDDGTLLDSFVPTSTDGVQHHVGGLATDGAHLWFTSLGQEQPTGEQTLTPGVGVLNPDLSVARTLTLGGLPLSFAVSSTQLFADKLEANQADLFRAGDFTYLGSFQPGGVVARVIHTDDGHFWALSASDAEMSFVLTRL